MNAVNALSERQQALRDWLLRGDPTIAARIEATSVRHETVQDRLRIYRDGYALRLIEVLGQDFPVLKARSGQARFDALAARYLQAHPSAHPSLRHFGARFASWLSQQRDGTPEEVELAAFEWAQGEVFDAADAIAMTLADVATLPAQDWPTLWLSPMPHPRLLTLSGNAAAQVAAHGAGQALPPARRQTPAHWLLWRQDFQVHWRRLDDDEAEAWSQVAADTGLGFADLCARLAPRHGEGGALRAASLLKHWIGDGLLAAPPSPTATTGA